MLEEKTKEELIERVKFVQNKYFELRNEKDNEIKKLNNILGKFEKELDNLIISNQSNISCNHYTPDDWKDSKLIGYTLYKMKPISLLAQELKDKLKEMKEDILK